MTTRRAALLLALAAAALAGITLPRGNAAQPSDLEQLADVQFVVVCRFSHMSFDDPIVYPGKPGRSHEHTFFGNVSTDAGSTPQSLHGQATTCSRSEDTAAYWAPTLYVAGQAVEPDDAKIYYRRRTVQRVQAFPPGLEMVAGDSHATRAQSLRITYWDCGEDQHGRFPPTSAIPNCISGRNLSLHVRFPDCWNGRDLDSVDHKSHMAYSTAGRCPADHPVAVPSIELIVRYPIAPAADAELASGGEYSGHADFVNAWQQDGLQRLVHDCLNALRSCGPAP
jgi:Domain of unknown function (DUF1996)